MPSIYFILKAPFREVQQNDPLVQLPHQHKIGFDVCVGQLDGSDGRACIVLGPQDIVWCGMVRMVSRSASIASVMVSDLCNSYRRCSYQSEPIRGL
jgi:hypothetical protein